MCFSKKLTLIILIVFGLFFSQNVFATDEFQSPTIPKPKTLPGPTSESAIENKDYLTSKLIPGFVSGSLGILGGVSFVMLIYGGIQYLITFQDEAHAEKAKKTIQYAIIGLLIGMFSYSLVNIISYLDGLNAEYDTEIKEVTICGKGYKNVNNMCLPE